jgi:ribonuclease R
VTHYVTPESVVDTEAQERATSVYLVDRTVPMLPERLCNDLCSLRPHEDKLAFSAVFKINEEADILEEWFGRTVIHSDRRFTYEEAQEVIESGKGDFVEEILSLHTLAQKLRSERFKHGAIAFAREEIRFTLDDKGRPTGVYTKVQKEANQLIEEFMLLANRRVAEFCAYRISNGRRVPRPMIYRVHDEPSEDKLDRFREFALRFGHYFKAQKGRAIAKEMNKLLGNIAGSAEANAITTLAVRSMAKAVYTTDNIGHYGLAFPFYTHFTSPIRRYPDMLVHRILALYLNNEKRVDKSYLERLAVHSTEREILASEAERASIKYKMAEFMKEHIGEEFEGVVSGMTDWGVYVELNDTHVEGMAFLRDIEDDYFRFDEARYEVVGRSSGIRLTLGSPVRIRVKGVDLNRRTLDFKLLFGKR